jgi:hypothetical protein
MANPASGSGDHPREETPAATPTATTTETGGQSDSRNAVPESAESIQKLQVTNPQVGDEDDEDSDFDELDGKHYQSTPQSHTQPTSHHACFSFSQITNIKVVQQTC